MANLSISSYIAQFPSSDWTSQCIQRLVEAGNQSIGYVDSNGLPLPHFVPNETWGIDRNTCLRYCNHTSIPLDFQFQTFAGAFINYLLPWIGLIAQLPVETETKGDALISLCLAVGSPVFITYSLALTINNRAWVREEFNKLRRNIQDVENMYGLFGQRLAAIQYVLEEAQQVPLRVSQEQGWFSSLIVAPQNGSWWTDLEAKLKNTRRGGTLSLVFQMGIAILAWLFTIIASFVGSLGDISTGLQISAGNIWCWMIPVILGWIRVGTQQLKKSIHEALETQNAVLALETRNAENRVYTQSRNQRGLVVAERTDSGLTRQTRRVSRLPQQAPQELSKFCNIRGDEKRIGPAFNYSRTFTYYHLIRTVTRAIRTTRDNIANRRSVSVGSQFQDQNHRTALQGDAAETESYCGLDRPECQIFAYPEWDEIPSDVWIGIGTSALVGLFLQWGTTGAALMIAYLTPTKGLGCRSGGYLLYGINASVCWLLMAVSALFSHSAMLRYQYKTQKEPPANTHAPQANGTGLQGNAAIPLAPIGSSTQADLSRWRRRGAFAVAWGWVPVRPLAAMTRYFGKSLAVANTLFLIAIALFEFTGGFDNCWCKSDTIGLHGSGWVVLFKTAHDLAQTASLQWGMGLMLSILVCLISFGYFWIGL